MVKPNRKAIVAANKPPSCEDCTDRVCLKTNKPCGAVELWVSQDFKGASKTERLQNSYPNPSIASGHSDWIDYLNNINDPVIPDRDASEVAWAKIQRMNLKPNHTEVIRLYYYEGMRNCEVAVAMGVTDQTVSRWRKYARMAIKDRLERLEFYKRNRRRRFKTINETMVFRKYFGELKSTTELAPEVGISTTHAGTLVKGIRRRFKK